MYSLLLVVGVLAVLLGFVGVIIGRLPRIKGRKKPALLLVIGIVCMTLYGSIVGEQAQTPNTPQTVQSTANNEVKPVDDQKKTETTNLEAAETKALKKYLYENFGGNGNAQLKVSWYDLITNVEVKTNQNKEKFAVISTSIYHDDEGKNAAKPIVSAVLGYTNSASSKVKFEWVDIKDKEGNYLVSRDNPIQ